MRRLLLIRSFYGAPFSYTLSPQYPLTLQAGPYRPHLDCYGDNHGPVAGTPELTLLVTLGLPLTDLGQMDLLLDGYISQTLTPRYTEKYLRLFIKCLEKEYRGSFITFYDGWVVARSRTARQPLQRRATTRSTTGNRSRARATTPPTTRTATRAPKIQFDNGGDDDADVNTDYEYEMFDRKVDLHAGTIVPQPTWIGVTEKSGVLCPIFFVRRDGALGVPYELPPPERSALHNATAPAPALLRRRNQNVRIRIQVCPPSSLPPTSPPPVRAEGAGAALVCSRFVNIFAFLWGSFSFAVVARV